MVENFHSAVLATYSNGPRYIRLFIQLRSLHWWVKGGGLSVGICKGPPLAE